MTRLTLALLAALLLASSSSAAAPRPAPDPTALLRPVDVSGLDERAFDLGPSGAPDVKPAGPSRRADGLPPPLRTGTVATGAPSPLAAGVPVARSGLASTYGPGWNGWSAIPEGPGWRIRVCGAGGCLRLVTTDAGPDRAMQRAGRVVDLDVPAFELVCGVPWRMGLCPATVTLEGRR